MNNFPANCPYWLSKKISDNDGFLSFYEYMDTVLNDPSHGFYGSGKAKVGIDGDFVTSPSMSNDFAYFVAKQIEDWLNQLFINNSSLNKLSVLEFGSGNGCLVKDIIYYFLENNSELIQKISFGIIEINEGMIIEQKRNLKEVMDIGVDINWMNLNEIKGKSINGIIIANELLDAFPVERVQYSKGKLYQQFVSLDKREALGLRNLNLNERLKKYLSRVNRFNGVQIPPKNVQEGWTTELHVDNLIWLEIVYEKMNNGILLIIDYALEANKYYSNKKNEGTLLAYKNQRASIDFLQNPGDCDLTSHLCSEILINEAKAVGFELIGLVKQGEALLKLGLAEKLYEIQLDHKIDLSKALLKREALLRLVDPLCLGNFKWFMFQKIKQNKFDLITKSIN